MTTSSTSTPTEKKRTNQTTFHRFLVHENACAAGYRFARKFQDAQEFWENCPWVGWIKWLADEIYYASFDNPDYYIWNKIPPELRARYELSSGNCILKTERARFSTGCEGIYYSTPGKLCSKCRKESLELAIEFKKFMPENPWVTWQKSLNALPKETQIGIDWGEPQ